MFNDYCNNPPGGRFNGCKYCFSIHRHYNNKSATTDTMFYRNGKNTSGRDRGGYACETFVHKEGIPLCEKEYDSLRRRILRHRTHERKHGKPHKNAWKIEHWFVKQPKTTTTTTTTTTQPPATEEEGLIRQDARCLRNDVHRIYGSDMDHAHNFRLVDSAMDRHALVAFDTFCSKTAQEDEQWLRKVPYHRNCTCKIDFDVARFVFEGGLTMYIPDGVYKVVGEDDNSDDDKSSDSDGSDSEDSEDSEDESDSYSVYSDSVSEPEYDDSHEDNDGGDDSHDEDSNVSCSRCGEEKRYWDTFESVSRCCKCGWEMYMV